VIIKEFAQFIVEKLGVIPHLSLIAEDILSNIKGKKYYKWQGEYLQKQVTINCFIMDIPNLEGSFQVENSQDFIFNIKISPDSKMKSTLIHELKHMDRAIRRKMKTDTYHYINHVGKYVAGKYTNLFKSKDAGEILVDTFYLCNPDEFEAYFHNLWEDISILITEDMTREQKIDIVRQTLENEQIWIIFKFYYTNPFDLMDFFNTESDCAYFLKEFIRVLDLFYNNKNFNMTNFDRFKIWFKSKVFNNQKLDRELLKEMNYYINKCVRSNYKKFSRLYTLVD
jgi:hypothetical protein